MRALGTAVAVLLADQASKYWIRSTFDYKEIVPVFPHFFSITYIRNKGGAFGIFPHQPYLFIILSLVTIGAIIYFLRSVNPRSGGFAIGIGLILGGAVGNLLDRVLLDERGCVTDWLDFHVGEYHWPAFNIADSAISAGVFLLLYLLLFTGGGQAGRRGSAG